MVLALKEELKKKADRVIDNEESNYLEELDEMYQILNRIDSTTDPILRLADRRAQDYGTYFFLVYSSTKNIEKSIRIYENIKCLIRHILLKDKYYETGKKEYLQKTQELMTFVIQNSSGYVEYTLEPMINKISAFWEFERIVKQRMLSGKKFTNRELRNYNLFKSSDTNWYSIILDSELKNFSLNVANMLHYNQALQDIMDDYDDIEEDLMEQMPNVFILAETGNTPIEKLFENPRISRKIILSKNKNKILSLVNDYEVLINSLILPEEFKFLENLAAYYIKNIRSILSKV